MTKIEVPQEIAEEVAIGQVGQRTGDKPRAGGSKDQGQGQKEATRTRSGTPPARRGGEGRKL